MIAWLLHWTLHSFLPIIKISGHVFRNYKLTPVRHKPIPTANGDKTENVPMKMAALGGWCDRKGLSTEMVFAGNLKRPLEEISFELISQEADIISVGSL